MKKSTSIINSTLDFQSLLNTFDQPFLLIDIDGTLILRNTMAEEYQQFLSIPVQEGENILLAIPPEKKQEVETTIREVIRTGDPCTIISHHKDKKERSVFLQATYSPVGNAEVQYICITCKDVTNQKLFESKINASYKELAKLIEQANAVIFCVDSRGYITEWNELCTKISGYAKEDVYTRKFADLLLPEIRRPEFYHLTEDILQGNSVTNCELNIKTNEGIILTILLNGTPRINADGQTIGIFFIGQDITELTEYRSSLEQKVIERTQALKEALKKEQEIAELKSRFVSIASHELRTPLASIAFATELVKKSKNRMSEEQLDAKLNGILKNVSNMVVLLDDILTLGKSESPKFAVSFTSLDFKNFITKLIEEVKLSTSTNHEVRVNFQIFNQEFTSDEKLLRNIFINLISNAIKYSPKKTPILIDVMQTYHELTVTIQDFGIGIKPDEIEKIFEPFHRASNVESISGTGLGLSIVKKAVEMLNGTIEVNSYPGAGSTFRVSLPKQ